MTTLYADCAMIAAKIGELNFPLKWFSIPNLYRYERPMRGRKGHRKVCQFCVDKMDYIDYKDVARLRRYMSERAKILPRRVTGTCARHQRDLTTAIKRARQIALVPFVTD